MVCSPVGTGSLLIQCHCPPGVCRQVRGKRTKWTKCSPRHQRSQQPRPLCVCVCKAQDYLDHDHKQFLMFAAVNKCQQLTDWLSWMSIPEDRLLAAVLGVSSCESRSKIGAREQFSFIPLVVGKGCNLNPSVCILMLRVAQM